MCGVGGGCEEDVGGGGADEKAVLLNFECGCRGEVAVVVVKVKQEVCDFAAAVSDESVGSGARTLELKFTGKAPPSVHELFFSHVRHVLA